VKKLKQKLVEAELSFVLSMENDREHVEEIAQAAQAATMIDLSFLGFVGEWHIVSFTYDRAVHQTYNGLFPGPVSVSVEARRRRP
jgi:hypothetical protein